jgi:hypothetical protein
MATLVARPVIATRRADDIFFTSMSVLMLAIVLVGFAPSYYLRGAVFAHLPSLLVHIHGAVFSSWIILFVIQSSLVSAGNVSLHRKLGVLGAVIAGLMVILGILTPLGTIHRAAVLPSFFTPESFLMGNIFGILVFGAYVAFAIWKRNNRIVHKRLMLMANAILTEPALSRMPIIQHYPMLIGLIPLGIIVALFVFDLFTQKRILAVTVIGGILFWAADGPVSDWIIARPFSHQLVLWAQNHP